MTKANNKGDLKLGMGEVLDLLNLKINGIKIEDIVQDRPKNRFSSSKIQKSKIEKDVAKNIKDNKRFVKEAILELALEGNPNRGNFREGTE